MHNQSEMRACELCQLSHAACYDTHLNFSISYSGIHGAVFGEIFWERKVEFRLGFLYYLTKKPKQNLGLTH